MPKTHLAANISAMVGVPHPVDLIKINVHNDTVLYICNHYEDLVTSYGSFEAGGHLLSISKSTETLKSFNTSFNFILSGVGDTVPSIALNEPMIGANITVLRGFIGDDGLLVADPYIRWIGFVNKFEIDVDQDSKNVKFECRNKVTTIFKKKGGRYTSTGSFDDKSMDFITRVREWSPQFGSEDPSHGSQRIGVV
jgi:hypothetical protein